MILRFHVEKKPTDAHKTQFWRSNFEYERQNYSSDHTYLLKGDSTGIVGIEGGTFSLTLALAFSKPTLA